MTRQSPANWTIDELVAYLLAKTITDVCTHRALNEAEVEALIYLHPWFPKRLAFGEVPS